MDINFDSPDKLAKIEKQITIGFIIGFTLICAGLTMAAYFWVTGQNQEVKSTHDTYQHLFKTQCLMEEARDHPRTPQNITDKYCDIVASARLLSD